MPSCADRCLGLALHFLSPGDVNICPIHIQPQKINGYIYLRTSCGHSKNVRLITCLFFLLWRQQAPVIETAVPPTHPKIATQLVPGHQRDAKMGKDTLKAQMTSQQALENTPVHIGNLVVLKDAADKALGMVSPAQRRHHLSGNEVPTAVTFGTIETLVIRCADVLPVLLEESGSRQIAAAHCGEGGEREVSEENTDTMRQAGPGQISGDSRPLPAALRHSGGTMLFSHDCDQPPSDRDDALHGSLPIGVSNPWDVIGGRP
ncbi:hypothetical protein JZ751_007107 [Albula glossodonta]|uniref:Uncharacterized protein n=1 Tax=Albula glossodonta TaxID=121402 RepID=A0A8T2PB96_9TELE|nr:hypothetical protein JZ751_007107 [Albula glossodonta]